MFYNLLYSLEFVAYVLPSAHALTLNLPCFYYSKSAKLRVFFRIDDTLYYPDLTTNVAVKLVIILVNL